MPTWTTGELTKLRESAGLGASELATMLGRSVQSVRSAAQRNRISLRRSGSRRGLVTGQLRGGHIDPQVREAIVSGRLAADALLSRMELQHTGDVCPCCGRHPVQVRSTGWCRVCHLRAQAEASRELLEELEAQRETWRERQRLKRARERSAE